MNKAVLITHKVFPLDSGDALYNWGIIEHFSTVVDLCVYTLIEKEGYKYKDSSIKYYSDYNSRNYYSSKMYLDLVECISKNKIKLILVSHHLMYLYHRKLRKKFPEATIIYISHNVEYLNDKERYNCALRKKAWNEKIIYFPYSQIRVFRSWLIEKELLTKSNAYLSISKTDAEIHKKLYKSIAKCYYLKPLIKFPNTCRSKDRRLFKKKIMILGSMSWYPNVNGVVWFCKNVMNVLASEGYMLYIIGSNPDPAILQCKEELRDNIIITGRVEKVDEYFNICDISIIPLFEGTGAKIKLLESMCRGILTVSTSYAAKDYDISNEIGIADSGEEFLNQIHKLENDLNYRLSIYNGISQYCENYFCLSEDISKLLVNESK
ncbi:glycosyltransferase [Butyrivibrio sp. MB2005]|uniref:glycosyltransferase n=1 Tax=Butyrivibrio sp. MB2005 TaxID=1280678 RepID=UPI0004251D87|nr:glycosyltransferase family 4 protein [Butyrivibrio sp. MB2005]